MILYSIIDMSDVLTDANDQINYKKTNIKRIDGGYVEFYNSINGASRVKRLYSTDPALYLDKRYYPF